MQDVPPQTKYALNKRKKKTNTTRNQPPRAAKPLFCCTKCSKLLFSNIKMNNHPLIKLWLIKSSNFCLIMLIFRHVKQQIPSGTQSCLPSFSLQQGVKLWKEPFGNTDKPLAAEIEAGASAETRWKAELRFTTQFYPKSCRRQFQHRRFSPCRTPFAIQVTEYYRSRQE